MSEIVRVSEISFHLQAHFRHFTDFYRNLPVLTGYNRIPSVFDELKIKVSIGIKKEKEGLSWF